MGRVVPSGAGWLRAAVIGVGIAFTAPGPVGVLPAFASQHAPVARVVQGRVVDKGGTPVKAAVVYLKDDHTLGIKSYIAGDDGSYRFGQLSQTVDYEVWAEAEGKKSPTRTISSFDTKETVTIELKLK